MPKQFLTDVSYPKGYTLTKIIPPRVGGRSFQGTSNLLGAVSKEGHPLSLEIVGTGRGVALMYRAAHDDTLFSSMMWTHFPSAIVEAVPSDADHLLVGPDEAAWTCTLKVEGQPYLPLRIFSNLDVQADHGADPMAALVGAHAGMDGHERVVTRIILKPLARDWSEPYKRLGLGGAGSHNAARSLEEQRSKSSSSKPSSSDGDGNGVLSVFGGLATAGLIGAFFWWKRRGKRAEVDDYVNPALAQSRINDLAYQIEIHITVLTNRHLGTENNARARMRSVIRAFKIFDHPGGSRLVVDCEIRPHTGNEDFLEFTKTAEKKGFSFLKIEKPTESVIGLHEVASMWHLPTKANRSIALEKSYSYDLAPPREMKDIQGAYVGDSTIGPPVEIKFSEDMTKKHQFIIARTGMGKSTLIQHCVSHKLAQKALGLDNDAIVVVDPHSDLVQSLLELIPAGLEKKVWLVDLSDEEHVPGINVLDAHIFPDRDHTCDGVVRVTKGIWDTWGSRMQNILEHTIKSLHEANSHPDTPREKQYTILDGKRMLSENDFRAAVLAKVHDPSLRRYWREFEKIRPHLRSEAVTSVQTRLAYFASTKKTRQILGQRSSTLDLRKAIEDGDIIFVNTAQGAVGRDVAALVGSSILNLVDAVIRQQGLKAEADRRGVYVVVDEMQTIPGVNFPGMLSEVRKVGGALCLVTQSLSSLDEVSDTMADIVMANTGCLIVFQVSGADAQRLVGELGKETISEDDITSLPDHTAYVRATVGGKRVPVFSIKLRPPQVGDPARARAIRDLAGGYTRSADDVEETLAEEYREDWDILPESAAADADVDRGLEFKDVPSLDSGGAPDPGNSARSRSRRSRADAPGGDSGEARAEDQEATQSGDGEDRTPDEQQPRTPRDSNIERFEDIL